MHIIIFVCCAAVPVKHEGHGLGLVLSAGRAQHRALVVDLVDVDNVLGLLLDFSDVQWPARYFVSIDKAPNLHDELIYLPISFSGAQRSCEKR